uniref:Transcription factor CBF/NF-Y/archaeal histone domain-containing protein n=2 Tax=Clastoptera arizonana TaxID=38151 RepID=A0A1B6C2W0_9HEMI
MPSKKKKYNARFPAGRIKKIMQTDEEVGKVAQAVPVIISRTLELFVNSLLTKAMEITNAKNAKTLTPSHMKQCILSESRFDFLKDLVKSLPDISACDEEGPSLLTNCDKVPPLTSLERRNSSSGVQVLQNVDRPTGYLSNSATSQPPASTVVPYRINPNFYKETPEHELMGISQTISPHISVSPSAYSFPLTFPSVKSYPTAEDSLVMDEDYDSVE